jgi:membrane-bound lytic murein transglycosylase D
MTLNKRLWLMKKYGILLFFCLFMAGCATGGGHSNWNKSTGDQAQSLAAPQYPDENLDLSTCKLSGKYGKGLGGSDEEILDSALEFCDVSNDYWQRGDLENALDALDQAYALILKIDSSKASPGILQQKEDLRFTISKRIAEVYASRFTVANGEHKAIPLDMNVHVATALSQFKGPERDFFLNAYKRSGRYRPAIVKAFREAGLPEELSWLPLIESGFKTRALSCARALGMWQFIASTGYKYGLTRGPWIDERMDPEKSTTAAIAYLQELHQIFGDWTTVLAAYNCGEGRVLREIRQQKINYMDNFWDLYQKLPMETASYVPRFLAVLHIVTNPKTHGFKLPSVDDEVEFDLVTIDKQVYLKTLAQRLDVSHLELSELNPALRQECTPPKPYQFRAPKGKGELFLAEIESMPAWEQAAPERVSATRRSASAPASTYSIHRVRKGETLSSISKRYGVSVNKLMAANKLSRKSRLDAGRKLKIPTGAAYARRDLPQPGKGAYAKKKTKSYVVRKGDSLYQIAGRFGTTTGEIRTLNRLPNNRLQVGQALKIPSASANVGSVKTKAYKVAKGDSAMQIASNHQMSLAEFLRLNNLTPRCTIYPGQTLLVKTE